MKWYLKYGSVWDAVVLESLCVNLLCVYRLWTLHFNSTSGKVERERVRERERESKNRFCERKGEIWASSPTNKNIMTGEPRNTSEYICLPVTRIVAANLHHSQSDCTVLANTISFTVIFIISNVIQTLSSNSYNEYP